MTRTLDAHTHTHTHTIAMSTVDDGIVGVVSEAVTWAGLGPVLHEELPSADIMVAQHTTLPLQAREGRDQPSAAPRGGEDSPQTPAGSGRARSPDS